MAAPTVPALSVVIAARDAAPWIGAQLSALTEQDYRGEFEILVCDNGSRDHTADVVAQFSLTCPQIRLVDASERPGQAFARNVGVSQARYDCIAFCDADDVVAPTWLRAMAEGLVVHPVVAGRCVTAEFNPGWTTVARPLPPPIQQDGFLPFAGAGNLAIRRQAFDAVGGFDLELSALEDVDFCWRLGLSGYDLGVAPEAVLAYRLRQSIRGIFGQGWAYGDARARLEDRYADQMLAHRASAPEPTSPSSARRMLTALSRHPGRGGWGFVLWHLGWHAGHRRSRVSLGTEPAGSAPRATNLRVS